MAKQDTDMRVDETLDGDSTELRVYELGFHLDPELPTEEVKKVVSYLKGQESIQELDTISLEPSGNRADLNSIYASSIGDDGEDDELYEEARIAVIEAGKASTSYLQRKFRLGYGRAARLIDMLEERGVIGPGDGAKPRAIIEGGRPPEEET